MTEPSYLPTESSRLLVLEGATNVRDLGGFPTATGQTTRFKRFVRADSMHRLTDADVAILKEYGITLSIDLRTSGGRERDPSRLAKRDDMRYEAVDLMASFSSEPQQDIYAVLPDSLAEFYLRLLDEAQTEIASVFRLFLSNTQHATLYHCTAGKDRTGIISMLLLQLAGVSASDIIQSYALSAFFIRSGNGGAINLSGFGSSSGVNAALFESEPAWMETAMHHLATRYGTAADYLQHIGLEPQEIETVRNSLVADN